MPHADENSIDARRTGHKGRRPRERETVYSPFNHIYTMTKQLLDNIGGWPEG